jgi:hypothetical protein
MEMLSEFQLSSRNPQAARAQKAKGFTTGNAHGYL